MKTLTRTALVALAAACLFTGSAFGASLAVNNTAAMGSSGGTACAGGECGLEVTFDGNTSPAFVRDDTPDNEALYRAEFWFNPNNITMNDGTFHVIFRATEESAFQAATQILFTFKSSLCRLSLRGLNNPGTTRFTNRINVPCDQATQLRVEWTRSDTPGALNGDMTLSVIGGAGPVGTSVSSSLNNSNLNVDFVNLGAVGNINPATSSTQWFDEFQSFRTAAE
ncbi:MAG: hypothetical protein AAF772_19265 [Acidobacteriota bacterium]